jgi:hypothetical protein
MTDEWLEPWYGVEDEGQRMLLEIELEKELSKGHPLWKSSRRVVAKRSDQDDVLVTTENGRVAEVHLTWSRKKEAGQWPSTVVFESIGEWRRQRMFPLHEEFNLS